MWASNKNPCLNDKNEIVSNNLSSGDIFLRLLKILVLDYISYISREKSFCGKFVLFAMVQERYT